MAEIVVAVLSGLLVFLVVMLGIVVVAEMYYSAGYTHTTAFLRTFGWFIATAIGFCYGYSRWPLR